MSSANLPVCLIEDDEIMGESLCERFAIENIPFVWCRTLSAARVTLQTQQCSLVLSDIRLPDGNGETLFSELGLSHDNRPPYVFMTGYGSVGRAVALIKAGAKDYVVKPFDIDQLIEKLQSIASLKEVDAEESIPHLGISAAMRRIESMIPRLSSHDENILLTGESGVGKERVARRLHETSPRRSAPFIAVNCGALSESLAESELFGFQKGSFTGASHSHRGFFEQAEKGTLFLDELAELSLPMQVKLLRAIQERQITRLGAERPTLIDFRLICATNAKLLDRVETGHFREDLYYRINVIQIRVPPLRERREDIGWLAESFIREYAERRQIAQLDIDSAILETLMRHDWPGNVRELRHAIERACILSENGRLSAEDLGLEERGCPKVTLDQTLQSFMSTQERDFLVRALSKNAGQIQKTAEALGISRKTLWEKMVRFGLKAQE